jgi:hypothetical protein
MKHLARLALGPSLALGLSLAAPAAADPGAPAGSAPAMDRIERAAPGDPRSARFGVDLGARAVFIDNAGFGPYSTSDLLPGLSVAASWVPGRIGAVSFAVVGEYDLGYQSATARGDATTLFVHRAAVGLEPRFRVGSRLDLFAKLAPGVLYLNGQITDADPSNPLSSSQWTWSLDTSGGAAFLLLRSSGSRHVTSLWLVGEIGYAFAGSADMIFAQSSSAGDPHNYGSITLPALRPAGFLDRWAISMRF